MKPLSKREIELAALAAAYKFKYRESNPEVGMGYAVYQTVEDILREIGIEPNSPQVTEVYNRIYAEFPELRDK